MASGQLIIFVRAPRLGAVKTRLAKGLGQAGALSAYRSLVETLLERLRGLRDVELHYTPREGAEEVTGWLQPGWQTYPQAEGDLGLRMGTAFETGFRRGAKRIALIGSDCPSIEVADIELAWAKLTTHEVVIGPALDGGYWLIGLRQPLPALFQDIKWSTPSVLDETVWRARQSGLRVHMLRPLADVDTVEDWLSYQRASLLATNASRKARVRKSG